MGYWPNWMECEEDDDKLMPVTRDPSDFVVFVAVGHTKHSAILRGFASTRSVTRRLDGDAVALESDGTGGEVPPV